MCTRVYIRIRTCRHRHTCLHQDPNLPSQSHLSTSGSQPAVTVTPVYISRIPTCAHSHTCLHQDPNLRHSHTCLHQDPNLPSQSHLSTSGSQPAVTVTPVYIRIPTCRHSHTCLHQDPNLLAVCLNSVHVCLCFHVLSYSHTLLIEFKTYTMLCSLYTFLVYFNAVRNVLGC